MLKLKSQVLTLDAVAPYGGSAAITTDNPKTPPDAAHSMSSKTYTAHHHVPQWYQRRFLPASGEAKFYYMDLTPETFVDAKGVRRCKTALWRWGTPKCFQEPDLYTTRFGSWQSTDIEKFFFGKVDDDGAPAVEWFSRLEHQNFKVSSDAFHDLLTYMSAQKLRTPKGLGYIAGLGDDMDKNMALLAMQQLQHLHCAIWTVFSTSRRRGSYPR